jgi:hypothetical protein
VDQCVAAQVAQFATGGNRMLASGGALVPVDNVSTRSFALHHLKELHVFPRCQADERLERNTICCHGVLHHRVFKGSLKGL